MQIDPNKVTWDEPSPSQATTAPTQAPQQSIDLGKVQWDSPATEPVASPAPGGQPAAPKRSVGQELGRQAGLTARAAINGVASLPALAADAVGGVANAGLDLVRGEGNGFRFPKQAEALNNALTQAGLPQPETAVERVAGDAASAIAGAGGTVALGRRLADTAASGVTRAVGQTLAVDPGLQVASAATGAGAAGATRELGGGEGAQLAAGLAGALVPSAATASSRRVLTPGGGQVRAAAQQAHEAGYVIPPADLGSGPVTETLSAISGKVKTAQEASARNQTVSNNLAKRALGLPETADLNIDTLEGLRRSAAAAYEPVAASGTVTPGKRYETALDRALAPFRSQSKSFPGTREPQVVADLQALRSPRFDAGDAMVMIRSMRESADRSFRAGENMAGKAYRQGAAALEDALEGHLQSMGQPAADMLQGFRDARQLIAKSYTVQKALNPQTGAVNAIKLAADLAKAKPLSGDLRTIAEAGQAFPKALQALKEAPKANSVLDVVTALGAGAITGSPLSVAMLGARPAARNILLSRSAQRNAVARAGTSVQPIPRSGPAIAVGAAGRTGDTEPQPERTYTNAIQAGYAARTSGGTVVPVNGGWVVR
jgi:hypothetical protein